MSIASRAAKWFRVVLVIALCGLCFVVAVFLQALGTSWWGQWKALLNVSVLFAVLGALYGTIAVFDSQSELSVEDRPGLRVVLCAFFGAAAVFVMWSWFPSKFHPAWLSAGALIGAMLGWFGWRWARYVDF